MTEEKMVSEGGSLVGRPITDSMRPVLLELWHYGSVGTYCYGSKRVMQGLVGRGLVEEFGESSSKRYRLTLEGRLEVVRLGLLPDSGEQVEVWVQLQRLLKEQVQRISGRPYYFECALPHPWKVVVALTASGAYAEEQREYVVAILFRHASDWYAHYLEGRAQWSMEELCAFWRKQVDQEVEKRVATAAREKAAEELRRAREREQKALEAG